jgi:hypothetical protein
MDFIEIAIIIMLCVLSFLIGQKFNHVKILPPSSKNDKYNKLPESYEEDEEVFSKKSLIFKKMLKRMRSLSWKLKKTCRRISKAIRKK